MDHDPQGRNSLVKEVINFSCRLCGSSQLSNLINLGGFPNAAQHFLDDLSETGSDIPVELRIHQCSSCGLVQLENEPVTYYKDVITAASLSDGSKNALVQEWEPFVEKYALDGKRAIEIGSGRGDFLEVLGRLNLRAIGLEHSQENVVFSRQKGLAIEQGYLLDWVDQSSQHYSLVVCNNFLEHQPQTHAFIAQIYSLLHDDGVVYISVPNLDYLLQKSCLYEFVADHLVYFTQASLRLAFEMNSFEVLEQYQKNNGNDLVLVAKKKNRLDLTQAKVAVDAIIGSVKTVVSNASKGGEKIAIWGAGHRALALMAMADLHEITYVVDSASFKQGKYTPILHKKIISPDMFLAANCDLLIVMLPGNYSQQVIQFLQDNKSSCRVLVFQDQVMRVS